MTDALVGTSSHDNLANLEGQDVENPPTFFDNSIELADMGRKESISFGYEPIYRDNAPVCLSWENLTVKTKPKKNHPEGKVLLDNLSGMITGGLWAIMGPSGSGKTTFLLTLSLRLDTFSMELQGNILLNGQEYSKHELKTMSGFVMQDDLVHAHLTVAETLTYTAKLRLPKDTTAEQRNVRETEVMKLVGITHVKDVIVGDSRRKGVSGGERKRLCIAMELLTAPKLLFLDEPTSGLDSSTANDVVEVLQGLAERGECTVVTTIHQPQTKIYNLFDNLILMRKGHIVYQGMASRAIDYFTTMGYPCPQYTNPADHFMNVLTMNSKAGKHDDQASVESHDVRDARARRNTIDLIKFVVPINPDYGGTSATPKLKDVQPWILQFWVLFQRSIQYHVRNWHIFVINLLVTCMIALFICLSVWRDIGDTKTSVAKRQPLLFFCCVHQGILAAMQGSHTFPLERSIMLRERAAGSYYVSSYFVSKTLADMIAQIPMPVIFTCFVYPIAGLQWTARHFFTFMGFMIMVSLSATSLANAVSCICVSIELSTVVLGIGLEWVRLFGGWFISPNQIELYPDWTFAFVLSFAQYGFVGVSLNENEGLVLHCTPSQLNSAGQCVMSPLAAVPAGTPVYGSQFNEYYGYNKYTVGECFWALVVYIVCCRVVGYLGLRFIKF